MREHPRNWLCQAAGCAPLRGLAERNPSTGSGQAKVREDWGWVYFSRVTRLEVSKRLPPACCTSA